MNKYLSIFQLLLILATSLYCHTTEALNFTERFSWPWSQATPSVNGRCTIGQDCWNIMGCVNQQNMMIRKFANSVVSDGEIHCPSEHVDISFSPDKQYFKSIQATVGVQNINHGGFSNNGSFALASVPAYSKPPTFPNSNPTEFANNAGGANEKTFNGAEVITSRNKQSNLRGEMEVEFYVHHNIGITSIEPNGTTDIDNKHYGIAAFMTGAGEIPSLPPVNPPVCGRECTTISDTDIIHAPFIFHGVIFGRLSIQNGAQTELVSGFAFERSCGTGSAETAAFKLPASGFMKYPSSSNVFPGNRWYKIHFERFITAEPPPKIGGELIIEEYYTYTVWTRTTPSQSWAAIGTRFIAEPDWSCLGKSFSLQPSYIGLFGLDDGDEADSDTHNQHVDWDRVFVDW